MLKKQFERLQINSSRVYLERFIRKAAQALAPGSLVLDAGAGESPYQNLFSHARYESTDLCKVGETDYSRVTYICDLSSIPAKNQSYDMIICTQVLEHVREPKAVLCEFYRILKPGGELWISAPLFYKEHQVPYDYYRYTQYGFRYLLEEAGFSVRLIEPLEGFYGTLSYQLAVAAGALPVNPQKYGGGLTGFLMAAGSIFIKPLFLCLSLLLDRLDLRYKQNRVGYCKNYAAVACKTTKPG